MFKKNYDSYIYVYSTRLGKWTNLHKIIKKLEAQTQKIQSLFGPIYIDNREWVLVMEYMPSIMTVNNKTCHIYYLFYTARNPRKIATPAFLKHIGKELGYEVISM